MASVERALSDRTRALLIVTPNNPTGSFVKPHELERLAAICAARDVAVDRRRGVRRLRARSRRLAVERTRPGTPGRPDVQSGGAVEIGRFAAGEAGLDCRRRPDDRRRATRWRGSSSRATRILSVSTPVQLAAPELLERGAVAAPADSGARDCELQSSGRQGRGDTDLPGAPRRGRLVRHRPRSLTLPGRGARARPACGRRRAGTSGLFFRLPARVVPGCQPARRRDVVPRGRVAHAPVSRVARQAGVSAPPAAAAPASSSPCFPVRRPRAGASATSAMSRRWPRGSPAPASACCNCCRSTRWRAARQSPYSAMSAMAIDPIFIRVPAVPEFAAIGGEVDAVVGRSGTSRRGAAFVPGGLSAGPALEARRVRGGLRALQRRGVAPRHGPRPRAAGVPRQPGVVDRRLRAVSGDSRARSRPAVDRVARAAPAPRYRRARARAPGALDATCCSTSTCSGWPTRSGERRAPRPRHNGVALFGDLPFMVDGDSADVWARQDEFRLDVSIGAPPDAFSATGQDWGMPAYRWDAVAADDFGWLRDRARRSAAISTTGTASTISSVSTGRTPGRATAASRSSRPPTKRSSSRSANAC